MRHLKAGRKLGISAPHRVAMLRSLTLALIEREKIKTTPARAKEVRRIADRMVTLAKKGNLTAQRKIVQTLGSTRTATVGANRVRLALKRLSTEYAPRFKSRNGGYTRITRIFPWRPGDGAQLCYLQYLPESDGGSRTKGRGKGKKAKSKPVSDKGAKKTKVAAPKAKAAAPKKAAPQDKPGKKPASKKAAKDKG